MPLGRLGLLRFELTGNGVLNSRTSNLGQPESRSHELDSVGHQDFGWTVKFRGTVHRIALLDLVATGRSTTTGQNL